MFERLGILAILLAGYGVSFGCPDGWADGVSGSMCYRYMGMKNLNYTGAKDLCRQEGGYVVMPKTSKEEKFVEDLITNVLKSTNWRAWIGATDTQVEGQWLWEDGEPFIYTHWASGQPDNAGYGEDCVEIYHAWNGWNDLACYNTITRPIVCQSKWVTCTNETAMVNISGTLLEISGYEYNDTLTYSCEPPFFKLEKGDLIRICTENETWNGMEPVCKRVTCTNETTMVNISGTLLQISGYEYNDTLTYSCVPPFFKLEKGDLIRTCTKNETWSGMEPVCNRVTCTGNTTSINSSGAMAEVSGYGYNDSLTYSCETPHFKLLGGDVLRKCTINGTWSGIEPVCERITCSNETAHVNSSGALTYVSGYHYNDTLMYSCEAPNHRHIMGDLLRTCMENGTWSGIEPTCSLMVCPNDASFINASGKLMTATGFNQNATLNYICNATTEELVGGNISRICMDGSWVGEEPTCKRCMCPCQTTSMMDEQLDAVFKSIIEGIKVDATKTSNSKRKKMSAKDDRASAQGMGYIGITMLVVVLLVILVPDIPRIYNHIKRISRNIKSRLF